MKYLFKPLLTLLIVFSTTMAKSAEPGSVAAVCKVVADEEKHYRVIYQAPDRSNVTIRLYNDKDEVIYKERQHATSGFMKKFDLSYLPNGEYQLELKADGYLFQEKITLGSVAGYNVVLSSYSSRQIMFVATHKEGKKMNLYILDQAGDVVYKETFEDSSAIHKMYNFKNLKSERVTFVLYHDDQLIKQKEIRF